MNRTNLGNEKPSIIQEIVFYDKPNIKTIVPQEILPESTALPLGKGDIVYSRIRKSSLLQTNFQKDQYVESSSPKAIDQETRAQDKRSLKNVDKISKPERTLSSEKNVENHSSDALNEKLNVKRESPTNGGFRDNFINYENLEEATLESIDIAQNSLEDSVEAVEPTAEITKDNNESIEQPSQAKKITKSVKQTKECNEASRDSTTEKEICTENLRSKKNQEISDTASKITKEASSALVKESPFKTPKRPAQKGVKKSQKITMLNYITKKSKNGDEPQSPLNQKVTSTEETIAKSKKESPTTKQTALEKPLSENILGGTVGKSEKVVKSQDLDDSEEESSENNTEVNKSSTDPKNTPTKRGRGRPKKAIRGRPRKATGSESQRMKSESYYSDEDVSFRSPEKNKNYTELTNVPIDSTKDSVEQGVIDTDDLEDLLDEAHEQVRTLDRVEEELQTMFTNEKGEERKQVTRGKRKTPGRKPKVPAMLVKKVKVEEITVEDNPLDISVNDYDTDGDSRGEWLPLEYAEYKQQHIMRNQSKLFPCKFCGDKFPSYYSMRKHRALTHDDLGKDRKEGSYKESVKCKQEKEQVDSDEESREEWMPQDYADYKMKHKLNKMKRVQWYKCKICCAVFSNYYKLSKHRIEHENKPNPYECKQCDARFKDVETLMAHIRVHQGKDPYQCKKCEKGFITKGELDEHIPVHILKKGPIPIKRFRCDICSKEFSKLCDIERHTRVHTGEKPCECNICHKRFQQSHNLSKHLLTHLHVKPFQCEICNKKFGRIDVLNRHLLTHSMDKPFKCEICNKGFIRQIQLTNHIEKFHTSSDRGLIVVQDKTNTFIAADPSEEGMEDDPGEEFVEDGPNQDDEENGGFEENEEGECEEVIVL